MKNILVTGSGGQLGTCLRDAFAAIGKDFEVLYTDYRQLDVCSLESWEAALKNFKPDVVINCAAYTSVDKAESEADAVFALNAEATQIMGKMASKHGFTPIHISTDYVFDGSKTSPYLPDDQTSPQNVYGQTKLKGEHLLLESCPQSIVIRTSWLYSVYGGNFVKTMLRLAGEKSEISVVADQTGRPTSAHSLAEALVKIAGEPDLKNKSGIYHYQNSGVPCSWAEFAEKIFYLAKKKVNVKHTGSGEYRTAAKRPAYSVLDCGKTEFNFGINIPDWMEELKKVIEKL